jgi:hypothetical protein
LRSSSGNTPAGDRTLGLILPKSMRDHAWHLRRCANLAGGRKYAQEHLAFLEKKDPPALLARRVCLPIRDGWIQDFAFFADMAAQPQLVI